MKKENKFLPLGSIVVLNRTTQKLIIIARGMLVKDNYYDYGAFLYPQGLIEDSLVYFNKDQIAKVDFHGFTDADDDLFIGYIEKAIENRESKEENTDVAEKVEDTAINQVENDDPFTSVRDM